MKKTGAVRHKFKQAAFRHLKRRLEADLRPSPENCTHNQTIRLAGFTEPVGICRFAWRADEWPGVCDSQVQDCSKNCPHFVSQHEKDFIKAEFHDFLASATLPQIAAEYPDLAALLWVMEDEAPNREVQIEEEEDFQDDTTEEPVEGLSFDVDGVPVYAKDLDDLAHVQEYLEGLAETATGHEEFAHKVLQERDNAVLALQEKEGEVTDLQRRVEDLERRVNAAEAAPQLPVPAAPQGFWGRLRWLFGGSP